MPDTRINRARLKNHLHYGKWIYIIIALVCLFFADLLYTMTEYRPPDERKVDFELVCGSYVNAEALSGAAARLLTAGQAYDDTLEAVTFLSIQYSGDANTDVYGAQKFTVMVAAGEGDIYVLPQSMMVSLWAQQGLKPLDDYIASGALDAGGLDLSGAMYPEPPADLPDGFIPPQPGAGNVYGIPVSDLAALREAGYVTDEPAYAVLMGYGKNPETSVRVLSEALKTLALPLTNEEASAS